MRTRNLLPLLLISICLFISTIYAVEDATPDKIKVEGDTITFDLFPEGQEYGDILKMPQEWIDRARGIVVNFIEANDVSELVVDYGIVGSFVYGCARSSDDPDPSDIDFIIYFNVDDIYDLPHETRVKLFQGRTYLDTVFQEELDTDLHIDLLLDSKTKLTYNDPNLFFYSLKDRKIYGRDQGEPFLGRLIWFEGKWYRVDRAAYDKLCAEHPQSKDKIHMQLGDNNKIQFIEPESGEILLESE